MDDPLNHLKKHTSETRLTGEAKSRIREHLLSYAKANPMYVSSPYTQFLSVVSTFSHPRFVSAFVLTLVIALGGSVALAAYGALPGQTLYTVKTSLLEPTQGFFAFSSQAQADWHLALAEARLKEVEDLAQKQELSPKVSAESQARFDQSFDAAEATLDRLAQDNPEAAAKTDATFSMALGTHQAMLDELSSSTATTSEKTENSKREVLAFADHVRSKVGQRFRATMSAKVHSGDDNDQGEEGGATATTAMMMSMTVLATSTATTTEQATTTASTTVSASATTSVQKSEDDESDDSFLKRVKRKFGL